MRAASAGAWAHSCLQVSTTQLLLLELCGAHDGWTQEQAEKVFAPLHAMTLPLSSITFQTGIDQLHSDLAASMPTEKHENWCSMLIRKPRRTIAMPYRPSKDVSGWQSWRRCCNCWI